MTLTAPLLSGPLLAMTAELRHSSPMSLHDVLEVASELSREEKSLLFTSLGEQLASDFNAHEVEDIRRAVAAADAEFEQGEGIPAEQFYKEVGL